MLNKYHFSQTVNNYLFPETFDISASSLLNCGLNLTQTLQSKLPDYVDWLSYCKRLTDHSGKILSKELVNLYKNVNNSRADDSVLEACLKDAYYQLRDPRLSLCTSETDNRLPIEKGSYLTFIIIGIAFCLAMFCCVSIYKKLNHRQETTSYPSHSMNNYRQGSDSSSHISSDSGPGIISYLASQYNKLRAEAEEYDRRREEQRRIEEERADLERERARGPVT